MKQRQGNEITNMAPPVSFILNSFFFCCIGGVPVNWDDENASTVDDDNSEVATEASEQEDSDEDEQEQSSSYPAGIKLNAPTYEIDEDSIPFVNYSNYNQDEYDSS